MELNFEALAKQKWKRWLIFCIFADDSKALVTVQAKDLKSAPKISFWVLSENGMIHRFWSHRLWDVEGRNIKKLLSQQKNETLCLQGLISC